MIKVVLSQEAKEDLTETGDYIAYQLRNKAAARNFVSRIRTAVTSLAQFPESGTPLAFAGLNIVYRYLVCGSYLIFYHLSENTVQIDRILYGRRDYLSILFGTELTDETSE